MAETIETLYALNIYSVKPHIDLKSFAAHARNSRGNITMKFDFKTPLLHRKAVQIIDLHC